MAAATEGARLANFARWVKRVVDDLRATNGWSMGELIERSGVSRGTIYGWIRGDFKAAPPGHRALATFCVNLDLDANEPYKLLGWLKGAPAPQTLHTEVARRLDAVLRDPNVDSAEKGMMTRMISGMLDRYRHNDTQDRRAV